MVPEGGRPVLVAEIAARTDAANGDRQRAARLRPCEGPLSPTRLREPGLKAVLELKVDEVERRAAPEDQDDREQHVASDRLERHAARIHRRGRFRSDRTSLPAEL